MPGVSLVVMSRGCSVVAVVALWLLLLLQSTDSRSAGFSSWGTWASLPRGMWNLPGQGIEPVYPALAGRFSTIGAPGKSCIIADFIKLSSLGWIII